MGMAAILVMWLWLAQWFQRRRCLKSAEAYLSYKLTNEPSAQVS